MTFQNGVDGGRPTQLDFNSHSYRTKGEVVMHGVPVAVIERKYWKMRSEYHLLVTAGLDMLLIVTLVVALADKARTTAAASAAGAGGGS